MEHHPVFPIALVVWIGALYGWKQLRLRASAKGRVLPPLGNLLARVFRFASREDLGPLFTKPEKFAAKVQGYTARRHYALMAVLAVGSHWLSVPGGPFPYLLLGGLPLIFRSRRVFQQRWSITRQMFDVAAAECRYPREAALNPTMWIQVQKWEDAVRPAETVVVFPASYASEELRTREKFERQFNGTVSDEHSWNYKWESSKNRVVCTPTPHLPKMVPYPGPFGHKWSEFPIGITSEGEATWQVNVAPHILVCGPTGSGKSVVQRMILFHALVHSDVWRIVAVDPKRVELGWLRNYKSVLQVALTLEDGVEVVRNVEAEMMRRFDEMEAHGVNHFQSLPQPPPALLVMIDETFAFLSPEGIKSDEGKERDALHAEASTLIGSIARLGRAAGVHLALATQRPDATVLKGELKNNLDARIAAGRMDTTPSLMVLDDEAATRLPKIKGRGVLRVGGEMSTYQGYFAEQEWYEQYAAGVEAGLIDPETGKRIGTVSEGDTEVDAGVGLLKRFAARRAAVVARNEAAVREAVETAAPREGRKKRRALSKHAAGSAAGETQTESQRPNGGASSSSRSNEQDDRLSEDVVAEPQPREPFGSTDGVNEMPEPYADAFDTDAHAPETVPDPGIEPNAPSPISPVAPPPGFSDVDDFGDDFAEFLSVPTLGLGSPAQDGPSVELPMTPDVQAADVADAGGFGLPDLSAAFGETPREQPTAPPLAPALPAQPGRPVQLPLQRPALPTRPPADER